ncbi:terpene synthase family protein [Chitinophaga qingshengii]|uniref:Terpene synthase n=1 Tax=Chitinophaga qingshengii TaxID=1569794 RepID=A0ABR7TSY5_9BACT|nr:terpene synthase [Chitinophaga qingshengii]MBC9932727.1 terpene synthase [Chitinophaga qingshengii]
MSPLLPDEAFYAGLQHLPKPRYPFPDFIHPHYQQQRKEYYDWIDREYTFHSKAAREKHKQHNLADIAARGCPFLSTLAELRPLANYTANGAMMDDYFDRCSRNEMYHITARIRSILTGEEYIEPTDNGIFHQFWILRQDAIKCAMPQRLYEKYIAAIHNVFVGYTEERTYYRANMPPPLSIYLIIRLHSSGGLPYCKYAAMQKNYRELPDDVLEHPHILRLHDLCSLLIGMHNDFISLPKELHREGDTMNLVKVIQHERKISIHEAYMEALQLHDNYLDEFMLLHQYLPPFGELQDMVYNYVQDLGIMVAGVYAWHTNDVSRYVNGGYVDGEYTSQEMDA